jgi:hypothetical protein
MISLHVGLSNIQDLSFKQIIQCFCWSENRMTYVYMCMYLFHKHIIIIISHLLIFRHAILCQKNAVDNGLMGSIGL